MHRHTNGFCGSTSFSLYGCLMLSIACAAHPATLYGDGHKHPVHQTAPDMNSVAHVVLIVPFLITLFLVVFVHWLLLLVVSNFDVAVVAFLGVILAVVVFFFLVEDVGVLFQVVVSVLVLMLLFLLLFLSLLFVLSDWWFYHTNSQKAYLFTDTQPEWDTSRYWEASAGSGAFGDFPDGSCSNRCGDKTSGCSYHKPLL